MVEIIHISYGGPVYWLTAGKQYHFEDHPYCGPIVLGKKGDPLEVQPPERSTFWQHVNAWYAQGKRFKTIGGKRWCIYETQMQAARRAVDTAITGLGRNIAKGDGGGNNGN